MEKCLKCSSSNIEKIILDRKIKHNNMNVKIKGINCFKCKDCEEIYMSNVEAIENYLKQIKTLAA